MKSLAPIALLVLLLCNTFGLSVAVIFFEEDYLLAPSTEAVSEQQLLKVYLPSLPYSADLEIPGRIEALIRHENQFYNPVQVQHSNDTLYITLQSNQAARDRFFELTAAMQMLSNQPGDAADHPGSKALKLLSELIKTYVPGNKQDFRISPPLPASESNRLPLAYSRSYPTVSVLVSNPPPERLS
ncbi:hypothetical protein [Dyadobacter sp. Leaf189]|uniref:hypothetical protein n=1 Tax=Dyadobacter sp. Leaf189 TaxID=1736295 RepID=UPI0006F59FF3|nr:hypothetical protein [Dyadobacter sp. Leaf189]KQS34204.1 hypothetical protein ASG33_09350 [Dyadobacter sp. Leaf189]